MASGKDILAIACGELGYKEGKNKDNKYGKWYGLNNDAWCMIFCQWVYAKAGIPLPYKIASCGALLRWYQKNQPECIVDEPQKGCLVIFDLPNTKFVTDHVGLYEASSGKYITTIDGNTSSTNDANGGYVNRRTRHVKYVHAYIVPRELEEDMDIDKIIAELTPEQAYKIYAKATDYMNTLPLPVNWNAAEQLQHAIHRGITDGTRPMAPCSRLEAALMADRRE